MIVTLKITVIPVPIFNLDNDVRVLPAMEVEEEEEELILILWLRLRGDWLQESGTEWLGKPDTTSPTIIIKYESELQENEKCMKNINNWTKTINMKNKKNKKCEIIKKIAWKVRSLFVKL